MADIGRTGGWKNLGAVLRVQLRWMRRLFFHGNSLPVKERPKGLVMIQIDGLGFAQLQAALHANRLPFLTRLTAQENYHFVSHYSGLPSSTPAVQSELFYGEPTAIPSFGFRQRESGRVTSMLAPSTATSVENRIATKGRGLLRNGSSYGNVFTGEARHHRFCLSAHRRVESASSKDSHAHPGPRWTVPLFILTFVRGVLLSGVEFLLALHDFVRGLITGKNIFKEVTFIPTRIAICVILRELVKYHVLRDISRGVEIIHANFVGYDEQAHRRGPSSRFAHWTLRGIDATLQILWEKARSAPRRDYQVWFYSDHGQEDTLPYRTYAKEDFMSALSRVCKAEGFATSVPRTLFGSIMHRRSILLYPDRRKTYGNGTQNPQENRLQVAGMGPVMHLYFPSGVLRDAHARLASALVTQACVPLVMFSGKSGTIVACTRRGTWRVPGQSSEVFGKDHPFRDVLARDIVQLVNHTNAGDLVLCGWQSGRQAVTFPTERGAHAGPGSHETHGFCCVPRAIPDFLTPARRFLRPLDLRNAALRHLGRRAPLVLKPGRLHGRESAGLRVRLMSFNIHSCIGIDGQVAPRRVACLIARSVPDVIALQEVDVNLERTGNMDQAARIARLLGMHYTAFPAWRRGAGFYGNAIISRYPLETTWGVQLPSRYGGEPRSACMVRLIAGKTSVELVSAHFSFIPLERHRQCAFLLDLLSPSLSLSPMCICGDFNMTPRSRSYRLMTRTYKDAWAQISPQRVNRTWMGLACLDYIFLNSWFQVQKVEVLRDRHARRVSDHAPVTAELSLTPP